jgi:hypothetical protein
VNLLPLLVEGKPLPARTLRWNFPYPPVRIKADGGVWAVRSGDWKLTHEALRSSPPAPVGSFTGTGRTGLYRITDDVSESNDLSAQYPEIRQRLQAQYDEWKAEFLPATDDTSKAERVLTTAGLFTQDFSSSTVVADYVCKTPGKNQFSRMSKASWSIDAGRLKLTKSNAFPAELMRWVAMEGTPASTMSFSFDMEVTGFSAPNNTRLYTGSIGEPESGKSWMAWGIDATGSDNGWKVAGTTQTFIGAQTISIKLNAGDAPLEYTDSLGGKQTLAVNSYDIWVGPALVAKGRSGKFVRDQYKLTSFAILLNAPATYYFDHFNVN